MLEVVVPRSNLRAEDVARARIVFFLRPSFLFSTLLIVDFTSHSARSRPDPSANLSSFPRTHALSNPFFHETLTSLERRRLQLLPISDNRRPHFRASATFGEEREGEGYPPDSLGGREKSQTPSPGSLAGRLIRGRRQGADIILGRLITGMY